MAKKLPAAFKQFKHYVDGTLYSQRNKIDRGEVENLLELTVKAIEAGAPLKEVKKVLYPYILAWHEDRTYG